MLHNAIAPDLFDMIDVGSPGDVDFYNQYARHRGGPVLVLLCGTGRIAIPLCRQGVPVLGVDSDGAMIESARRKAQEFGANRILFAKADPTDFVSDSRHPLVIIPGGAFGRLLTLEDQRNALLAVRGALALGGRLVLDMPLHAPGQPLSPEPVLRRLGARMAAISRQRRYDPARQVIQETIACEWLSADGLVEGKEYAVYTERYSTPGELELLFEMCGFAPTFLGSFDRHPLMTGAARLIVEAERAE